MAKLKVYFLIIIMIFIVSCQASKLELSPTSTSSIATETLTPQPTDTSQPSPTLALLSQDWYGTWTIFDVEAQGPNWMNFYEDGTFSVAHGPEQGIILHEGTYELIGNEITFFDWWYCPPEQLQATYLIRMYPDNLSFRLFPIDDPCEERVNDFTNRIIRWSKVLP